MIIPDIDTNRIQDDYKDVEFKPLKFYLKNARNIIHRYAGYIGPGFHAFITSEDAISYVAYHLMRSEYLYDPERGMSKSSYFVTRGIWAINNLRTAFFKNKHYQFLHSDGHDDEEGDIWDTVECPRSKDPQDILAEKSDEFKKFLRGISCGASLSEKEESFLYRHFGLSETVQEMATADNTTRQNVYQTIERALGKIRQVYKEGEI